jgi:hypothetical protein
MEGRNHETRHMGILAGGIKRIVLGARIIGANCGARFHRVWNQAVVNEIKLGHMCR